MGSFRFGSFRFARRPPLPLRTLLFSQSNLRYPPFRVFASPFLVFSAACVACGKANGTPHHPGVFPDSLDPHVVTKMSKVLQCGEASPGHRTCDEMLTVVGTRASWAIGTSNGKVFVRPSVEPSFDRSIKCVPTTTVQWYLDSPKDSTRAFHPHCYKQLVLYVELLYALR